MEVLNFNGKKILCSSKSSQTILSEGILFVSTNKKYIIPKNEYKKEFKNFINLNIKFIQNFMKENNLIKIRLFNPIIENTLFFTRQIDYTNEMITLSITINYPNWNKSFSVKEFKEYMKNVNFYVSLHSIYINIPPSLIDSTLTLNNLQEKQLEKINNKLQELEEASFPEIKLEFKVHEKFKTGIKQYIIYFNEYVEKTKGITINFEVENYSEGLVLKLNKNQDIERIGEYFEEYMNFLKYEKIEDIQPLYEINKNEYEKNKDKILLQNEIRELQYKYQTAQLLLETEKKHSFDYKCMIDKMLNQNNINFHNQLPYSSNIALTLNNTNTNSNINTINISQQIENLQKDIEKIKDFFKELEIKDKEEELNEIDDEILEVSNPEDLKSKKKMFNKFKRIVNQINDENSTLNETIKAAKKGKEYLEKIKPYIPTILTTISNLGEYFK